jgi:hypothetical protein
VKQLASSALNPKGAFPCLMGTSVFLLGLHAASWFIYSMVSSNLPVSAQVSSLVTVLPFFIIVFLLGVRVGLA